MAELNLEELARWLWGDEATPERVTSMVENWKLSPGSAERWAQIRAREQARAEGGKR